VAPAHQKPSQLRDRPARRTAVGMLAVLMAAGPGATACSRGTGASTPGSSAGASASTGTTVVYPSLPDVAFTYKLTKQPDSYEVSYSHARITLRDKPEFSLSFLVDPEHLDADSTLVAQNKAIGDKRGWAITPITVDGGSGYKAEFTVTGEKYLFYFFAKGPISTTLRASLGNDGDASARQDAEHIISSFKFDTTRLKGPYAGKHPSQAIPISFDMPKALAASSYATATPEYHVNLLYGTQKVQVGVDTADTVDAAAASFKDKKDRIVAAGATPHDMKTLPATANGIAKDIDEGFSLHIDVDGKPNAVAFMFRRGKQLITLNATVDGTTTQHTLDALQAPLDIVDS
jgi:hypothetical protein